jgi:hypothetical protein
LASRCREIGEYGETSPRSSTHVVLCARRLAQTKKQPTLYIGPADKGDGDAYIVLKKAIQDLGAAVTLVIREPADFGSIYSFVPEPYVAKNIESRSRCSFAVSIYRERDGTEVFTHVGHGEAADDHACLERAAWDVAVKLREYFQEEIRQSGG